MNREKECCPKFNPEKWNEKTFVWKNKSFIKDKVFTLFCMPVNFGSAMKRCYGALEKSGAKILDGMWLSDHTSKWNMNLYLAVDKKISGAENVTLGGKFFSKVYEGNFKDSGKWCENFKEFAKSRKLEIGKQYMWYTTCPKCAKKYGKNYVVIVGEVKIE